MRTLSTALKSGLFDAESSHLVLWLITMSGTGMSTLRLCQNNEDVSSRGNTYTGIGSRVILPNDTEERFQPARLVMENVDQWLTPTIRAMAISPDVLLELVSATDLSASPPEFDTVEITSFPFKLRNVSYDAQRVTAVLGFEDLAVSRWPYDQVTPVDFPGSYGE